MAKKSAPKKPHSPTPDFSDPEAEKPKMVCSRCGKKEDLDGECEAEGM